MSEKNRYSRIYTARFEHIELPAKLLDYFLRSNKSNIYQNRQQSLITMHPKVLKVIRYKLIFWGQ